ncbi:MAG: aryldialkylphosphatase [Pseudomonadota bacterium]
MRLKRSDLVGKAQTVLGRVDPMALGPTLLHEHVLCDIRPPDWKDMEPVGREIAISEHWPINYGEVKAPGNLQLDEVEVAVREVARMVEDGGRTIVDLSCGGLSPDPAGLVEVSKRTGAHIVMGCGHYVDEYQDPENAARTVESFAQEMADQVFEGAWNTNVRAGMIGEIGCQTPWTALERRVMEAAVIAMEETGAALNVHPGRNADQPQEVADFLLARGVDMSRVVISHIDRTIFDAERLLRLADTGVVVEFDLFGMELSYYKWNEDVDMPNDAVRLGWIRQLLDTGHAGQIAISHDICYRSRLSSFGGHGYGHIFRNVVPYMLRRQFDQSEIDEILLHTPRRLLTFI